MRKILTLLVFWFLCIHANAQLTSIKQLKDLNKENDYYEHLKSLVERYGVIGTEEVRQANNYFPEKPLTNRAFAIMIVNALDRLQKRFNRLTVKMTQSSRDSLFNIFIKKHYRGYADSAVRALTGYAVYKDINNDDPDHASIKRLTNFYRLKLGATEDTFSPDRPMTDKALQKIITEYFGEKSIVTRTSSLLTTRGKWAIYLNNLLDRLHEAVTDLAASTK